MRFKRMCIIPTLVGAFFILSAGNASAASNVVLRGQCGGAVSNWQGYINNLAAFGAVQQAAEINRYAGYSSTDGSFTQWMKDRVIVTRLAAPATITNYGCNSSGVFNAGKKHLSKGWPVLVALPAKYTKNDIRLQPTRGYKAVTVYVKLVGQATCTNPGKATVKVVVWVKAPVKAAPLPKPKPAPKPIPKPAPKPTPGPVAVCILNGVPQYVQPNGYIINAQGVCVVQQQTSVVCSGDQITIRDSNGVAIACQSQQQQQTQIVNVPVTVVVTTPPVVVTPPVVTLSPTCSANLTANKSNREVALQASGTASNGTTPTTATWVLSKNGAIVGTASGLSTTFAFADYQTTYTVFVTVVWSEGSATCGTSVTTGAPLPPLPGG